MACTGYELIQTDVDRLINCFIDALNSSKSSIILTAIQALILCLANFHDEMTKFIGQILSSFRKVFELENEIGYFVLEFLMRKLQRKLNSIDS